MTLIFAHRGSKGTHPENTLAAFKEAVRVGADGIELDIHLTKDQQLVVIHDETVDRTTDGFGEINQLTLKEIKKLDAGSWFTRNPVQQEIPTFNEVLELLYEEQFKGVLNVEIKTDQFQYVTIERKIVEHLKLREWPFDYMYSSFHFPSLEKVLAFDDTKKIAYIVKESNREIERAVNASFIEGIHPNIQWIIKHLKSLDSFPKTIRPWTVNSKELIEICLNNHLSGIHTDFPEYAVYLRDMIQGKG